MSIVNLGTQTINWKYKTSLKGSNLSRMFNGCISPGIYLNNGSYIQANIGLITSYAGNQITINAFEAIFKASSTQTVHIGTSTAIALSTDGGLGYITESYPYITMSYSWADQIINYIDFAFKASGSITAYDLIIGKAIFTGGVVTSIDYSEASYPPYYNPTTQEYNVFGGIKLDGKKINKELTTDIDVNMSTSELLCDTSLFFSPTADRTLDITAGASNYGTSLKIYHSGSLNYKVTITYASAQTVVLTRKMFLNLEYTPNGWQFVKESRIGQISSGYIIPRGGAELNGSLRNKDALWHYISEYYSALIDTETNWQTGLVGNFSDYDSTQYRLPDFRGLFERNAGTNSKRQTATNSFYTGGNAGNVNNDTFQGHRHGVSQTGDSIEGGPSGRRTSMQVSSQTGQTLEPVSDTINGTPRTGAETKPASISLIPFIYFED